MTVALQRRHAADRARAHEVVRVNPVERNRKSRTGAETFYYCKNKSACAGCEATRSKPAPKCRKLTAKIPTQSLNADATAVGRSLTELDAFFKVKTDQ